MDELEAEKVEMEIWAQELYLTENMQTKQEKDYRRRQSALYNKFHPDLVSDMTD